MSALGLARVEPVGLADPRLLAHIGQQAVVALYDEIELAPKPGLVSFVDNGSHSDMDANTFVRSLFALRRSFPAMAQLGAAHARFAALEAEGIAAEVQMMRATGGVNTHRGAIFTLGLLCAAAGRCVASGERMTASAVRGVLVDTWGEDLSQRATRSSNSHGSRAARQFGLRSVGVEAAEGFPVLFEVVWPRLRSALSRGLPVRHARLEALFAAMSVLDDTNLVHRGGIEGLRFAQSVARGFLDHGGAQRPHAQAQAEAIHREFVARNLSPGGSADLLAAACWLQRIAAQG
jgi:triphosphoribosyl-dephospho-CoA synthase